MAADAAEADGALAASPFRLLDAMIARLDASRTAQISTSLSEKARTAEYTYWETLGFKGIPGGTVLARRFP